MRRPSAALGCALAASLACTAPRTQIVLLIDTDMTQGPTGQLTHVRVTVGQPGAPPRQRLTYRLDRAARGAGLYVLPGTLGITALDNDGTRSVEVKVDAVADLVGPGSDVSPLFTYTAIAPFESEQTLLMPVFLAGRCRTAPPCEPGFTCGRERCEAIRRTLSSVPPSFSLPGGADASGTLDAPPDAASDAADEPPNDLAGDATGDLAGDAARDATSDLAGDAAPDATDEIARDGAGDAASEVSGDAACAAPLVHCGGGCVDLRSAVEHCGACGNRCPAGANAAAVCRSGACGFACERGFGDCTSAPGCETNTGTSITDCGACGIVCPMGPQATPACRGGTCIPDCATGFLDCNADPRDGCEFAVARCPASTGCGSTIGVCNPTTRSGECRLAPAARCGQACSVDGIPGLCDERGLCIMGEVICPGDAGVDGGSRPDGG